MLVRLKDSSIPTLTASMTAAAQRVDRWPQWKREAFSLRYQPAPQPAQPTKEQ